MSNPFSNVAHIIIENAPVNWLEAALKELASDIETNIHNAKYFSLQSAIRTKFRALKKSAQQFEIELNLGRFILDAPTEYFECSPKARRSAQEIISLCDRALLIHPGKAGAPKAPGRTICAVVIIEAWAVARHGKAPSKNNQKALEACDYYWRAVNKSDPRKSDRIDWSHYIDVARNFKRPYRNYVRGFMLRQREGA